MVGKQGQFISKGLVSSQVLQGPAMITAMFSADI